MSFIQTKATSPLTTRERQVGAFISECGFKTISTDEQTMYSFREGIVSWDDVIELIARQQGIK